MATVKGKLYSESEKEPVYMANIFVSDASGKPLSPIKGTASDEKGIFSLQGISDTAFVTVSHITVPKETVKVSTLPKDTQGNYLLNRNYKAQIYTDPIVTVTAPRIPTRSEPKREPQPNVPIKKAGLSKAGIIGLSLLSIAAIVGTSIYVYKN